MKTLLLILVTPIILLVDARASELGAVRASPTKDGTCALSQSIDNRKGTPLIYGDPYRVSSLELKFVEKSTGASISPKAVHIHYYWQWLEYPYPEHEWGAWVDGEELLTCTSLGKDTLKVPELLVKPRGWYDGKYVRFPWSKKPHFDRLEIVVEQGGDFPRIIVHKSDLQKYRASIATVELSSGPPEVRFDEKRSHKEGALPATPTIR